MWNRLRVKQKWVSKISVLEIWGKLLIRSGTGCPCPSLSWPGLEIARARATLDLKNVIGNDQSASKILRSVNILTEYCANRVHVDRYSLVSSWMSWLLDCSHFCAVIKQVCSAVYYLFITNGTLSGVTTSQAPECRCKTVISATFIHSLYWQIVVAYNSTLSTAMYEEVELDKSFTSRQG